MALFVWITPGEVHSDFKRRDNYTASRRVGKMHYWIAVSFNVLPAQRVSFDVLTTQRVYPWYSISDGFILPRDNQSPTDTPWVLMCDQHRFILLERSSLMDTIDHTRNETRQLRRPDDKLVTFPFPQYQTMWRQRMTTTTMTRGGGGDNRSEWQQQRWRRIRSRRQA